MGKQDISNRTLATLLVVAIVISLGGTYLVMQNAPSITGLAFSNTSQGTFGFTNQGFLAISLDDASVTFGNITHTDAGPCYIQSEAFPYNVSCGSDADFTTGQGSFLLNNTGNINANVSVAIASGLNGALGSGGQLSVKVASGLGCRDASGTANVGVNMIWKELFDDSTDSYHAGQILCHNLTYLPGGSTDDQIKVVFNMTVDTDALVKTTAGVNVDFTAIVA